MSCTHSHTYHALISPIHSSREKDPFRTSQRLCGPRKEDQSNSNISGGSSDTQSCMPNTFGQCQIIPTVRTECVQLFMHIHVCEQDCGLSALQESIQTLDRPWRGVRL
jgi:hypothetical protein